MNHIVIIAEAGVNHNGDMEKAKELIRVAADSGADYVKFQSFKASKLVSPTAKKAEYQSKNINNADDFQFNMLKKLELSHNDHLELISYCKEIGVNFLSTAFDSEGVDYLDSLGIELFKIPSGEITNYPYLKAIAKKRKQVVMSTGMANIEEVNTALNVLLKYGLKKEQITILHCNTEYPTPMKDVNLKAMCQIANELDVAVGYSDHTMGIEVSVAAAAMGAKIIEKHFTLDRNLPGPDHKASLEPEELKKMVASIRNIELAIGGSGQKEPSDSEAKNILIARKSIHVKRAMKKGEVLEEKELIGLRPGDGISPMEWLNVVGKVLKIDISAFHKLKKEDMI